MTVVDPRALHKAVDDMRHALKDLCDPTRRSYIRERWNPTRETWELDTGNVTRHEAPALLALLRQEVANSSNRGGRRRTSHSSPVGVDALDLWNNITSGALVLAAQTGAHIDGADPDHVLRASTAAAGGSTDLELVWGVKLALQGWVRAIRTLLDPPKRVPLWGATCPVPTCHTPTVFRLDESDGETKRTAALEVVLEEDQYGEMKAVSCRCLSCGEEWPRARLWFLARLLGRDLVGVDEEGNPAA